MAEFSAESYDRYVNSMKQRTKALALEAIRVLRTLPHDEISRVIGRQLLRSATSVGANYRAACRVRTPKEFSAKLRIVVEEVDESQYWLELLSEAGIARAENTHVLQKEATELTAIFTKALETARRKLLNRKKTL